MVGEEEVQKSSRDALFHVELPRFIGLPRKLITYVKHDADKKAFDIAHTYDGEALALDIVDKRIDGLGFLVKIEAAHSDSLLSTSGTLTLAPADEPIEDAEVLECTQEPRGAWCTFEWDFKATCQGCPLYDTYDVKNDRFWWLPPLGPWQGDGFLKWGETGKFATMDFTMPPFIGVPRVLNVRVGEPQPRTPDGETGWPDGGKTRFLLSHTYDGYHLDASVGLHQNEPELSPFAEAKAFSCGAVGAAACSSSEFALPWGATFFFKPPAWEGASKGDFAFKGKASVENGGATGFVDFYEDCHPDAEYEENYTHSCSYAGGHNKITANVTFSASVATSSTNLNVQAAISKKNPVADAGLSSPEVPIVDMDTIANANGDLARISVDYSLEDSTIKMEVEAFPRDGDGPQKADYPNAGQEDGPPAEGPPGPVTLKIAVGRPADFDAYAEFEVTLPLGENGQMPEDPLSGNWGNPDQSSVVTAKLGMKLDALELNVDVPTEYSSVSMKTSDWRSGDNFEFLAKESKPDHAEQRLSVKLANAKEVYVDVAVGDANSDEGEFLQGVLKVESCCSPQFIFDILSADVAEKLAVEGSIKAKDVDGAGDFKLLHGGFSGKGTLKGEGTEGETLALNCEMRHCIPFQDCKVKEEKFFFDISAGSTNADSDKIPMLKSTIDISNAATASAEARFGPGAMAAGLLLKPLWKITVPEEFNIYFKGMAEGSETVTLDFVHTCIEDDWQVGFAAMSTAPFSPNENFTATAGLHWHDGLTLNSRIELERVHDFIDCYDEKCECDPRIDACESDSAPKRKTVTAATADVELKDPKWSSQLVFKNDERGTGNGNEPVQEWGEVLGASAEVGYGSTANGEESWEFKAQVARQASSADPERNPQCDACGDSGSLLVTASAVIGDLEMHSIANVSMGGKKPGSEYLVDGAFAFEPSMLNFSADSVDGKDKDMIGIHASAGPECTTSRKRSLQDVEAEPEPEDGGCGPWPVKVDFGIADSSEAMEVLADVNVYTADKQSDGTNRLSVVAVAGNMQKDGGYMSGAITASDPNAEGEDGPAFEVGMAGTNGFLPMADRAGSHGAELAVNVTLGPSDLRVALFVTRASDSEDLDSIGLDVDLAGVSTDYRTELREPGVAAGLCLAEEAGGKKWKARLCAYETGFDDENRGDGSCGTARREDLCPSYDRLTEWDESVSICDGFDTFTGKANTDEVSEEEAAKRCLSHPWCTGYTLSEDGHDIALVYYVTTTSPSDGDKCVVKVNKDDGSLHDPTCGPEEVTSEGCEFVGAASGRPSPSQDFMNFKELDEELNKEETFKIDVGVEIGSVLGCLSHASYHEVDISAQSCKLEVGAKPSAPMSVVTKSVYREVQSKAAEMLHLLNLWNRAERTTSTVSSEFSIAGANEEAQEALVEALLAPSSSAAVKESFAESIAESAGIDAEKVEITEVAESVEGSLEFDFGDSAADVEAAYANPETKAVIEETLQTAVASGLDDVEKDDVTILGVGGSRRLGSDGSRRLAGTAVDYAIKVPLGTGATVAAAVTAMDTTAVASNAAQGMKEAAAENTALAELATVEVVVAPPPPPTVEIVVEYEVKVEAGEGGDTAEKLQNMDATDLGETVTTNVQAADESLADVTLEEVVLAPVEVEEAPTPSPTPQPTPATPPPTNPSPPKDEPDDIEADAVRGALALAAFVIVETFASTLA
jgi:hypothetical protein